MNGQWHQMRENYLVKFLILGITFYGLQTLQGPMQAIRTFSAFIHYTDWVPAHIHMGTMGWVSMISLCQHLLSWFRGSTAVNSTASRWPTCISG